MDIRPSFGSSSKPSTSASRMSSTSNSDESEEEIEVTPSKKPCIRKSSPPKKHSNTVEGQATGSTSKPGKRIQLARI